jgi:hypothetical protein
MATTLPSWMRNALYATGVMNLLAGIAFLPPAAGVRALMGLPAGNDPLYLTLVALFVALFGVGYFWTAMANRPERLFVALGAIGKLGFFLLVVGFWLAGSLPAMALGAGAADLVFVVLFFQWLRG